MLSFAGFPDFGPAISEKKVNIGRLLEIRESAECEEFRRWLATIENTPDTEIQERLRSLRSKLGNSIQTVEGKAVRLLASTGIGAISAIAPVATVAGLAAGAIDSFILERLLPRSGPVAFINKLYPSVFEER